jgi:hypothetical protein
MKKAVYLTGVVFLLSFALAGCDNEVADGPVVMKVRLAGRVGEEESALRSSAARVVAAERMALATGEELVAELVEDVAGAETLRAINEFVDGVRFRVIALKYSDKTLVDYEDYVDNDIAAYSPITVPNRNEKYDFICYSYGSTSYLPAATGYVVGQSLPAGATVNALVGTDPLYYHSLRNQTPTVTSLDGLVLTKQTATVKLRLDCSALGKMITGVPGAITFGPLGTASSATLAPATADVPTNLSATIAQTFTWPASLNSPEVTSHPITVIPKAASNLTLTIPKNAITLTGVTTHKATSVTFSNVAIVSGRNYTLQISFKKGVWAASNIYWDPTLGGLTFKERGDPGLANENFYQGVYFQWGSLVGISPAGTDFEIGTNGVSDGTTIYVYHDGQWRATNVATACSEGYTGFSSTDVSWSGIPYKTGTFPTGGSASTMYYVDNLGSTFSNNAGDICRFIGEHGGPSGYRMPVVAELTASTASISWGTDTDNIGWYKGTTTFETPTLGQDDATGRRLIGYAEGYGGYAIHYSSTFPAAGYRSSDTNIGLSGVGTGGLYWGSTGVGSTNSYLVRLFNSWMSSDNLSRRSAFPVRCVLNP